MITTCLNRMRHWLIQEWQWPAASLFAGGFLLLLFPLWYFAAGPLVSIVYLQLPLYMLHQWEEHDGDRFRKYINLHVAGGREALTPLATFWINALGVWVVDLVAVYLAGFVRPSLGLMAVYLPLINCLLHLGPAIARREYNPGLCTAVLLFLPFGGWAWYVMNAAGADWQAHALGFSVAVAVHVAIVAHVARRIASLSRSPRQATAHA